MSGADDRLKAEMEEDYLVAICNHAGAMYRSGDVYPEDGGLCLGSFRSWWKSLTPKQIDGIYASIISELTNKQMEFVRYSRRFPHLFKRLSPATPQGER